MIELLSKIFIKNRENTADVKVRKAYGVMMSGVGIVINVLLSLSKFIAGSLSGSISITADALNNLSDAATQIISLISFKMSAKPADRLHPFGHARIEYVASMIVSFLILLVGFELGRESFLKILHPAPSEFSLIVPLVLAGSIAAKLWLGLSSRHVARKIDSPVLRATATDSFSDVLATTAVLVSASVGHFTSFNLDGYMGLAVSVMIFIGGIKILNETKNAILGTPPDKGLLDAIRGIAGEFPDILGIHDIVVHQYGAGNTIASMDAEVDGARDVYYIHDVIDKLEKRLYDELFVQATIHADPTVTNDERFSRLRALAEAAARKVDARLSIHDCRYAGGEGGMRLCFDLAIPYECKREDNELCEALRATIAESEPLLALEIKVDRR